MTPSPEQLEHMRLAQRASLRNAQTFNLFTMLVAGGKRPDEALKDAEAAMDVWEEYEDAHAIEPPPGSSMGELLSKLGDMTDRLAKRRGLSPRKAQPRTRATKHDGGLPQ
jgi:hypothetical protein